MAKKLEKPENEKAIAMAAFSGSWTIYFYSDRARLTNVHTEEEVVMFLGDLYSLSDKIQENVNKKVTFEVRKKSND